VCVVERDVRREKTNALGRVTLKKISDAAPQDGANQNIGIENKYLNASGFFLAGAFA
jgi:hypothetical protein